MHRLELDNHYRADDDILLFLNDKFRQIKQTHLIGHSLDGNWPDPVHVREIVGKSSGQFIYASVVINYVSSSRHHPAQRLEIIRGLRPVGNSTPFAQLDALYKHIFSQGVSDFENTSLLLATQLMDNSYGMAPDGYFDKDEVHILLVDLASVLTLKSDGFVTFLHASLLDFLLDQTRSQEYYLDKKLYCTRPFYSMLRQDK